MKKSDFSFDYPPELVADYPPEDRTSARLLCVPVSGECMDKKFSDISEFLDPGDLLVVNDTRVMKARLFGHKHSGGKIEILIERVIAPDMALAQIKASKAPQAGTELIVADTRLRVDKRVGDLFKLRLLDAEDFAALMEAQGNTPLPVYIRRKAETVDEGRYQTVYAKQPGSVAAPTAGLHFDDTLLEQLQSKGIILETLTLHVGAGTFQPIRTEHLSDHVMHSEIVNVSEHLCEAVAQCKRQKKKVVAVGSTVLRALESAADETGVLRPFAGETNLFIRPGYRFKVPDALITNFHLPESTLFVLVCAFAGHARMLESYRHAVEQSYHFFSYGDAMYLEKNDAI